MKAFAFALVVLLAGASALPNEVSDVGVKDQRFVDEILIGLIEGLKQLIKDLGLDPLEILQAEGKYNFPVNGIFKAQGSVEDLQLTGLSDINIDDVNFDGTTLSVAIELPKIEASVGYAAGEAVVLSRKLDGELSGRLAIKNIRLAARANLGFTGYFIEDLSLDCSLGGIESELDVTILGRNISDFLNKYLGETLPSQLDKYQDELNKVLANFILAVIDRIL